MSGFTAFFCLFWHQMSSWNLLEFRKCTYDTTPPRIQHNNGTTALWNLLFSDDLRSTTTPSAHWAEQRARPASRNPPLNRPGWVCKCAPLCGGSDQKKNKDKKKRTVRGQSSYKLCWWQQGLKNNLPSLPLRNCTKQKTPWTPFGVVFLKYRIVLGDVFSTIYSELSKGLGDKLKEKGPYSQFDQIFQNWSQVLCLSEQKK